MPGIACPLANRKVGDIDYYVVRENTEGEYSTVGGRLFEGTEREMAMQQSTFTRKGVDRIMKFAFELAMKRPRKKVTSATKSNGIAITMPYWDERFKAMAAQYPQVQTDQYHIDGLTIQLVLNPQRFDVIVASNLFGDIISDLGPATAGTIGIAPSANINPERAFPSLFEPVHGSAPDIYGKKIANPIGQIWSGAMLLEHLGHADAGTSHHARDRAVPAGRPAHPGYRREGEHRGYGEGDRCRDLVSQPSHSPGPESTSIRRASPSRMRTWAGGAARSRRTSGAPRMAVVAMTAAPMATSAHNPTTTSSASGISAMSAAGTSSFASQPEPAPERRNTQTRLPGR